MLMHGSNFKNKALETDILIIGTGPAGITLAIELINNGKSVILTDAGSERYSENSQQNYKAGSFPEHYADPHKSRLRQLGGTSNHWANNTSPLSPVDFEPREWLDCPSWPISYAELLPYYKKAEIYCGVGGDGYTTKSLSPDHKPVMSKDNPFIEMGIAKAAIPPTRFFDKQRETLLNHPNVTVIYEMDFTGFIWLEQEKKVAGATFKTGETTLTINAERVVMAMGGMENARMLLVENEKHAHALGNQGGCVGRYFMDHPTLKGAQLFTPNPDRFNGLKGHLVDDYSRYALGFLQLREDTLLSEGLSNIRLPLERSTELELSEGVSGFHGILDVLRGRAPLSRGPRYLSSALMEWDLVGQAALNKLNGPQLIKRSDKLSGYQINLMMEQRPERNNRITLSSKKDLLGRPLLSVEWALSDVDKKRLWRGLDYFSKGVSFDSLGRVKTLAHHAHRIFGDQIGFGHHHMGTTRMSFSPEFGVVDENLQVHGVKNLFIAGSSVFSTGGHVPPTLTIVALSIRLSRHLSN